MTREQYSAVNESFSARYIYRIGQSAGFFSEYNNMILAIHYCLFHKIQFVLQSQGANFSINHGWADFFVPFCEEVNDKLLFFNGREPVLLQSKRKRIARCVRKTLKPHDLYMYELWDAIRHQENVVYDIPELGLRGTLLENCQKIHKMVWVYQQETKAEIEQLIRSVSLTKPYVGMQIRRGDKGVEHAIYTNESYMSKIRDKERYTDFFVLCDDYSVIEELRQAYPSFNFQTLCRATERGYVFSSLMAQSPVEKWEAHLRLWASMDLLGAADFFVGMLSANPGMNMGFRLPEARIIGVDYDKWVLW